jgi:catechol-2,3-dioxygenase
VAVYGALVTVCFNDWNRNKGIIKQNHSTIEAIGQIAIAVSDIKQSLSFYRDQLGLPFLFEAGPNLAFLQCAGVRSMLTTLQG